VFATDGRTRVVWLKSFNGLSLQPVDPGHFHQLNDLIGAHFKLKVIGSLVGFISTFSLCRYSGSNDKVSSW
jgi:hypothetical protein